MARHATADELVNAADPALDTVTMREIVEKSVTLLEKKCIRLNGHDPDWRGLFTGQLEDLLKSESRVDFEARVNTILSRGGLSHVAFFREGGPSAPARYAINATFCDTDTPDGVRWLFQDVHQGGPAFAAGIRAGDVLLEAGGRSVVPPILPTFALGTDHTLTVRGVNEQNRQVVVVLPKAESNGKPGAKPPMAEPSSVTGAVIRPGVGYVRVAFFPGVNGQRFARALDGCIAELAGCDRLIVDLRGNLGGFVGSLRLMSYLTPDRLPIGYSLTRKGEDAGWRPEQLPCLDRLPATKLDMIKMAIRFKVLHRDRSIRLITEGLGPKPFHGRVVILTNEHTLSAGEMVAAFAKQNTLATIVGTRTGGQVLGGANFAVGDGFTLRLPAAGWYSWSGSIVEGVGVSPDEEVPLSKEALRRGVNNQLEAAIRAVESV